jgi:hypothetical protein
VLVDLPLPSGTPYRALQPRFSKPMVVIERVEENVYRVRNEETAAEIVCHHDRMRPTKLKTVNLEEIRLPPIIEDNFDKN